MDFSVAMCVYGGDNAEWFRSAVDSVICQTAAPSEIVLVVDGPVPEILDEQIRKYEKDPMFHVVRLEQNVGHGNARRIGLENCKFDLVALMDADDLSLPNRFEEQLKRFAEEDGVAVVGSDIVEFEGTPENRLGQRTVPERDADIKKYMKKRCPMNQVTVMFRKDAVQKAGGYQDWFCDEDYYLWVRMALNGATFANTGTTLVNVRIGQDMYARRGGWKYFKSEAKLQKFMRKNGLIGFGRYFVNVTERFILQVLMPNRLRGWVFRKVARKKVQN